jgi:putative hydrolase of the HAD superfamily
MRELRDRGYRMAICTNNIREWEDLWRAKLPVDEIFDVVVDSSREGTRKPERRIYEITLERLAVAADQALLVDDLEMNCGAARELGMRAVWFRDTEQATAEIRSVLAEA